MVDNTEYPITSQMCMTRNVGTHGNLFGGMMMAWMDEAGAIFARTYTNQDHVVTVRFDEIVFKHPVTVGQIVRFTARNTVLGRTSISFELVGRVKEEEVVHTSCTFVALSREGKPVEISRSGA